MTQMKKIKNKINQRKKLKKINKKIKNNKILMTKYLRMMMKIMNQQLILFRAKIEAIVQMMMVTLFKNKILKKINKLKIIILISYIVKLKHQKVIN